MRDRNRPLRGLLSRRDAIGLGAAGLTALLARPAIAQALRFAGRELVSTTFGGANQALFQRLVYDRITAQTGARSSQLPMLSTQALARMRTEARAPQIDLFMYSGGQEVVAKQDGLTQALPAGANFDSVPAELKDPDGHWLAWGQLTEGVLYRTDRMAAPRSYNDFARPEWQGHVAIPHISNSYGVDFLVMLARANGGSETNIEPGFAAMKKFAGRATFFRAPAEVQTLFANGDSWAMFYDSGTAMRTAKAGLPVAFATPDEGAPYSLLTACVARRSANADIASAVLDWHLDPQVQAAVASEIGWAPTNRKTSLPAEVTPFMAPPSKQVALDRNVINAQRAAWTERWEREVASR